MGNLDAGTHRFEDEIIPEVNDVLKFEIELAKIQKPRSERRTITRLHNLMQLSAFNSLVSNFEINWKAYFQLMAPIKEVLGKNGDGNEALLNKTG